MKNGRIDSRWYIVGCLVADLIYWLVNGLIDYYFFAIVHGRTMMETAIFDLQDFQIFRRCSSLLIALAVGWVIAKLVEKQRKTEDALREEVIKQKETEDALREEVIKLNKAERALLREKDFSRLVINSIGEELAVIDVKNF